MNLKKILFPFIVLTPLLAMNVFGCSSNTTENNSILPPINNYPNIPPINHPVETPTPPPSNLPKGWGYKTNTKAEDVQQFSLEHNKSLHFNYPVYKDNLVSMQADGSPTFNIPGEGIIPGSPAQENYLTDNMHIQIAKQSYSVGFHNGSEAAGTAWILDYKLTEKGKYPLTWYFGTNAHVLDDLKVKNDRLYPEKFGQWNDKLKKFRTRNTDGISLWSLANYKLNSQYKDNYSNPDWKETRINFYNNKPEGNNETLQPDGTWSGYYSENPPIKTIFTGNDFLKTSPQDSSINSFAKNREEYADFAVFELTFENEQQAKETTNDYANWNENLKFKYHEKEDLVKNPSLQTDQVFTMGFPQSETIGGVAYRSIAVNVNIHDFKNNKNKGNGLTTSRHYNSWTGKPGKYDGTISMPWFGYTYEYVDNSDYSDNPTRTKQFSTSGLIYGTNNGCMRPGSSGSLVLDANGYALGIHFGSDYNAATGSAQAFYSSGFDYKGYYGNHYLPQYDLIRGGYPLQKNSYFDGLVKLYGNNPNFKTRLFPNGLTNRK